MKLKEHWTKFKDSVIRPAQDKKNVNRIGMTLSNNYVLPVLIILIDIFLFLLFNYILNSILACFDAFIDHSGYSGCFSIRNVLPDIELIFSSQTVRYLYAFFLVALAILDGMYVYQMKSSLSEDFFNEGQKGDSRFKTIEEIQKEYKEIPEKDVSFPGRGGTVISRYKDKLYIDDSIVNNLIIGMTRSGKGEFYVFPTIDILSRAEEKASMIITDPKTELFRSSKKTLESRGYDVYFLNLDQPVKSMGYNPLELITRYYKQGNIDDAEMLADAFAYSIYTPDDSKSTGNEKFFNESAASIFSGLILSHIKDCLTEDERLNEKRINTFLKKQNAFKSLDEKQQEVAKKSFDDQILTKDFMDDDIRYIPDDLDLSFVEPIHKYEKCINVYSILNMIVELSESIPDTDDTMLDEYFRQRPALDAGKMRYSSAMVAGDRTKGSILSTLINGLNVFKNRAIAKMTADSTLDFDEIGFGEKPIAVFLGIPDYDRSKWFLATVFIRQAYYYLAQKCARKTGKCRRHVKFLCDEFGNMPAIDDMAGTVTVCLGRNISFDMYIQSYAQLSERYGDKTRETIEGNCGNVIYIFTNSKETSETFSELLGHRTRKIMQRSGEKLSTNKSFIESLDQEPLMYPENLRRLLEGECVILSSMHRKDLAGNDVVPYPIFNSRATHTAFKYRYTYLQDSFPDPDTISLAEMNQYSRKDIDPDILVWDSRLSFLQYQSQKRDEPVFSDLPANDQTQIINILKDEMGTDFDDSLFQDDTPLRSILATIQPYPISEFKKKSIIDWILMCQSRSGVSA